MRKGAVGGGIGCGVTARHGALRPLSGRPAGISLSQVASARWYCGLLVLMGVALLNMTLLPWNVGSGNLGNPCERMQATAFR